MHLYAHSWSPKLMMVTETNKMINFFGASCFVYSMVIYWIAILFIGIMFSFGKFFEVG